MSLKQYIQANPDKTLVDAKLETELVESLISIPRMRLFLSEADLFLLFYDITNGKLDTIDAEGNDVIHPAKVYCKLVTSTLDGTSTDDNDFNFIQSTDTGKSIIKKTEAMRDIALPEYKDEIQLLLDMCIAKCNAITYPFAEVTQEDWDKAQLELSLVGETSGVVSYDQLDSSQAFHVRNSGNITKIRFELPEFKDYDTTITLRCLERDNVNDSFLELPSPIYTNIVIEAGSLGTTITLKKYYGRHTQYKATSNRNDGFTALVTQQSAY